MIEFMMVKYVRYQTSIMISYVLVLQVIDTLKACLSKHIKEAQLKTKCE